MTSRCSRSAPLRRTSSAASAPPPPLSRSSSAGGSVVTAPSFTPSISRSTAPAPQRVVSLLYDDSVASAVSIGGPFNFKPPIVASKKLTVLSRLKVRVFRHHSAAAVVDLTVVQVAVSRQVTAFRKRSGVRKRACGACAEEDGLRRTRSCSSFVRVKWQKMTYNDVQVVLQDTAVKLKLLLEKVTGVPVAPQKLTCSGKILKYNVSLYVAWC